MNDGMNDVLATRERSMGLYAWHECVHDEEEAGEEHRLGDITGGGSLLDFSFGLFFFRPPSGRIWHVVGYGMDYLLPNGHAAIGMAWTFVFSTELGYIASCCMVGYW